MMLTVKSSKESARFAKYSNDELIQEYQDGMRYMADHTNPRDARVYRSQWLKRVTDELARRGVFLDD